MAFEDFKNAAAEIVNDSAIINPYKDPFDKRLTFAINVQRGDLPGEKIVRAPYSSSIGTVADTMYYDQDELEKKLAEEKISNATEIADANRNAISRARKERDFMFRQSIMNPIAGAHFPGAFGNSDDINYLVDSSSHRYWYEHEYHTTTGEGLDDYSGYSRNPTTTNIISWGNENEEGKTPYRYQDFVFCKYWNKIPNNHMITLRRYTQPVYDDMTTLDQRKDNDKRDVFPPIATAVTYFGEDTGNSLSSILKFKTGMKWKDIKSEVWTVSGVDQESTVDAFGDIGGIFGKGLAHLMNATSMITKGADGVGGSTWKNGVPPDPYTSGPYQNRLLGPVDSINSVKARDMGLDFDMSGLSLIFEYVARPIGGINSKAVLLDILSNFLVMGSASAVFFAGKNRVYGGRKVPFPTVRNSIWQRLVRADGDLFAERDFMGDGSETSVIGSIVGQFNNLFSGGAADVFNTILENAKGMWNWIANEISYMTNGLLNAPKAGGKTSGNLKDGMRKLLAGKVKSKMTIPYITGLHSLLLGDPVGEWHLTIGNPMNPIATIGNLICTGVEVEFDEEAGLGPDDFPLGIKVTVSLENGMPRDRDALESMFIGGQGRIYELPKEFKTSSNRETIAEQGQEGGKKGAVTSGNAVVNQNKFQPEYSNIERVSSKNVAFIANAPYIQMDGKTGVEAKSITTRMPSIPVSKAAFEKATAS